MHKPALYAALIGCATLVGCSVHQKSGPYEQSVGPDGVRQSGPGGKQEVTWEGVRQSGPGGEQEVSRDGVRQESR